MSDSALATPRTVSFLDRLTGSVVETATTAYASVAAAAGAVLFALYILFVSTTIVVTPDANWDILPYLAVAEENAHPDPAALHAFAYSAVREGVEDWQYAPLVAGDAFRQRMASDPAGFYSMLPMYRVKVLYAESVSLFSAVMPPVAAIRAVSIVSTLLFGLIALLWLRREGALALAPALAGVMIVAHFNDVARVGSPDMMASALLLGGAFALRQGREAWTGVLFFLAFLVRPDNLVFLAGLAVLLGLARQLSWGVLAALAASLLVYVPLSSWAGHPGWWPHLYFTSIAQQMNMAGFDPAFSPLLYLKAVLRSAVFSLTMTTWVGVVLLAIAGWFAADLAGVRFGRRTGALFAALLLGIAAKFVVFPFHETRIFFPNLIPPFLLLAPLLMATVATRQNPLSSAK